MSDEKAKAPRVGIKQKAILEKVNSGISLCIQHGRGSKEKYYYSNGSNVDSDAASRCMKSGYFTLNNDGLIQGSGQSVRLSQKRHRGDSNMSDAATQETPKLAPIPGGEINGVTADRLRGFFERIERVRDEKKGLSDDEKEIFSEAKSLGFNVPVMRDVLKLREMEQQERLEKEELIDVYKHALQMG